MVSGVDVGGVIVGGVGLGVGVVGVGVGVNFVAVDSFVGIARNTNETIVYVCFFFRITHPPSRNNLSQSHH